MKTFLSSIVLFLFFTEAFAQWQLTSPIGAESIRQIIPSNSQIIAAAHMSHLYISNDTGANWQPDAGISDFYCLDTAGGCIFAGTGSDGVYCSCNGGISWSQVNAGLPYNYIRYESVFCLASDSVNQFAGVHGYGLYRRDLSGGSWTNVLSTTENITEISISQGKIVILQEDSVFISHDEGASWQLINICMPSTFCTNDTIWAGTYSSGLCYSVDNGSTWSFSNSGIQQILGNYPPFVKIGKSGNYLYASAYDSNDPENSGFYYSVNGGANWSTFSAHPESSYVTSFIQLDDKFFVSTMMSGIWMSNDSGSSWQFCKLSGTEQELNDFEVEGEIIYACSWNCGVVKSVDYGEHWEPCNYGLPVQTYVSISADSSWIYVESQYQGAYCSGDSGKSWHFVGPYGNEFGTKILCKNGKVFAGTEHGLYMSDLGEASLQTVFLSGISEVTGIFSDGANVFIGSNESIFRSENNGQTWTALSLPIGIYGYVSDFYKTDNNLYAYISGNEYNSILYSNNLGNSWGVLIDSIPTDQSFDPYDYFITGDSNQLFFNSDAVSSEFNYLNISPDGGNTIYEDYSFSAFSLGYLIPEKLELTDSLAYIGFYSGIAKTSMSNFLLDTIAGFCYYDADENGIYTPGESFMQGISIMQDQFVTQNRTTDSSGYFEFQGYYPSTHISPLYYSPYLLSSPTFYNNTSSSFTNDFGFFVTPGILDGSVYLSQINSAKAGCNFSVDLIYCNFSNDTIVDTISMNYYGPIDFSSSTGLYSNSQNTINVSTGEILPLQCNSNTIVFQVADTASIGAEIILNASFIPLTSDAYPSNNYDTLAIVVNGPYDPNSKYSLIPNELTVSQLYSYPEIVYKISFQNVGTDTAHNVTIKDYVPFSNMLNVRKFRYLYSNHRCTYSIDNDDVITFLFKDVMLPDSTTNELASHGYVMFALKPLENLPVGAEILNEASIYFDYNSPVLTNTDTIKLIQFTGTKEFSEQRKLSIFPNPATNEIEVCASENVLDGVLYVFNSLGNMVYIQNSINNSLVHVDTHWLSQGMYFIVLKSKHAEFHGSFEIVD